MIKCCIVYLLLLTELLIVGCRSIERKQQLDIAKITQSDLEALISKEMTIDGLEKIIGKPVRSFIHDHRGYLFYGDSLHPKITFSVIGQYITGARLGEDYIKGVTPHIYELRVSNQFVSNQDSSVRWVSVFWVNDRRFEQYEDLKRYLLELPSDSILKYIASCMNMRAVEPQHQTVSIEDVKDFCKNKGILFIHLPSG